MVLFDRRQYKVEADRLINDFFAEQYPNGTWVELESINELDVLFIDFWRKQDEQHGAICIARPTNGNCAVCDALQEIRPGPISGISHALHRRVLGTSAGYLFGRLIIRLSAFRSPMAM